MPSTLAVAYQQRLRQVSLAAETATVTAWDSLGEWRDPQVPEFTAQAATVDAAARGLIVSTTDAYLAEFVAAATDSAPTLHGLDPDRYTRGVPDADVWGRPFVHAWTKVSEGASWSEAVRFGRQMAAQIAATNVQVAARGAARDWMEGEPRVVGYRRVLGGGKSCDLCIVASTQRYHRSDLMPIHHSCRCAVEPIVGTGDPSQVVGRQTLEFVKANADGYTRAALRRSGRDIADLPQVKVVDHGELGPLLWDRSHSFATL